MDIDIYDYVQRWSINYIVYHSSHLREYGDVESANTLFSAQYQQAVNKAQTAGIEAQISSIQEQMQLKAPSAVSGLKILSDLEIGTLLDSTLDQIAAGINEGIELAGGQVDFENYNTILQQVGSFNNLLSTGTPEIQRVNDFFRLLISALTKANMINVNVLDALTQIGRQLIGTSFQIDQAQQSYVMAVGKGDINIAKDVIDSLNRAVTRLSEQGSVNSRSFANTIAYIFRRVIGNQISQAIVAEGISIGVNTADSILDKVIAQSGGKLRWVDKGQNNVSKSKGTTNIFNNDTFSLQVTKGNQTFNIEIGTNVNARWQNKKMSQNKISASSSMNVGEYFSGQPEKYLAYNMIAHRYTGADFEESFNNIRASVAASFFNQWIQSSEFSSQKGHLGQFIIVNGRVFSIQRIINNICDDIVRNSAHEVVSIGGEGALGNKWYGNSGANILDAITRSNIVNGVINKLTIAATLNNNILSKYAY